MKRVPLLVIAVAAGVMAQTPAPAPQKKAPPRGNTPSVITIMDTQDMSTRVVYRSPFIFEAPNWSPDGKYLLLNSRGKLWKLAVEGGEPVAVDSGSINRLNNDHGISADGKWYAISAQQVYILPSSGGEPKQITKATPSYFHTWSPDGKQIVLISFEKGTEGHPPNKNVMLRMLPVVNGRPDASKIRVVARLFGGQGTMNVNSWSPDSHYFAFVSYEKAPE